MLSCYGRKGEARLPDFPIDGLHPQAGNATEAARCAHEQGKFWESHVALFVNAPEAGTQQLKAYAPQLGLDVSSFKRCLASGTHAAAVQKRVYENIRLGVRGTPAFFVNGELV